jgi:predicted AAA+ superfamily ATPase
MKDNLRHDQHPTGRLSPGTGESRVAGTTRRAFIRRQLEPELRQSIRRSPITALLGPRRIGKTTLLRKIYHEFAGAVFIELDDPQTLTLVRESPEIFRQTHVEPYDIILLDDFHHVAHGGRILRLILERHPGKKIVLTGSLSLERTVGSLGMVRAHIDAHTLLPLTLRELVRWQDSRLADRFDELSARLDETRFHDMLPEIPADLNLALSRMFEIYLVYGGYPQVHQNERYDSLAGRLAELRGYCRRQVQRGSQAATREDDAPFMRFVAERTGQTLTPDSVARAIRCDGPHAYGLLQYWEAAFVLRRLPSFGDETPPGGGRFFFQDPGLRNAWLDNLAPFQERRDRGALLQNYVAVTLAARGLDLRYWPAEKDGISFVMDDGLERIPLAVLTGRTPESPEETFRPFLERYEPPRLMVLNASIAACRRYGSSTLYFLPYWLI